jgi:RNA polymerase sigma-70 factor (ECF subfamily)
MMVNAEYNSLIIKRLKVGDEKVFNLLMDLYYEKLCAYAHTLVHRHDISEDLIQNVFVNLWLIKNDLNEALSIKNYLYKSVYNEFIDHYRKRKPVIYLEKKYLESLDRVLEETDQGLDRLIALMNKEIENLPKKCKQVFLLNKKEGLTHTEISEYLNISVKTIEGHITRAFKILSKKIGESTDILLFLLFYHENLNKLKIR